MTDPDADPVEPFVTIRISQLAHALKAELAAAGKPVIHMEFGQPSTGAPAAAIAAAHQVLDSEPMGYWHNEALKARIARHYAETYGVTITPAQVTLTCGASPALVLALLTRLRPGARVAMASPGYVAYRNTVRALAMQPVEVACGAATQYRLTADALAALLPQSDGVPDGVPDALIIASPANPTGAIIPPAELARIAAYCAAAGIAIISDEIYHGLSFGAATASLLEFAPDAFVINSFSKYYSMAGWRLGWLVSPPSFAPAAAARGSNLFLTPPSLAQHAGLVAMDCRDELDAHRATYAANRAVMLAALPGMGLARIAPPDGAFYIWADVSGITDDSYALAEALLRDTGVVTAPGIDFDPREGQRFLRFSFAVSEAETGEAIRRMTPWFAARRR